MVYLDEPETPDTFESACLDLDEREMGVTGVVGGSSTCVLGRFWKLKPHHAPGLSGSGLAGRGEGLVELQKRQGQHEANVTYCAGKTLKGTKPGGDSETNTAGSDCTGGVLILMVDCEYPSRLASMLTDGDPRNVGRVREGVRSWRDCHRRTLVNHRPCEKEGQRKYIPAFSDDLCGISVKDGTVVTV